MENDARFIAPYMWITSGWHCLHCVCVYQPFHRHEHEKKRLLLYHPHPPQKATRCNYCERIKFSFLSFNYSTCLLSFNIAAERACMLSLARWLRNRGRSWDGECIMMMRTRIKSRAEAIFKLLNYSSLPFHCGWKTRFWWFFRSSPLFASSGLSFRSTLVIFFFFTWTCTSEWKTIWWKTSFGVVAEWSF